MQRHWNRTSYFVIGEGTVEEPPFFGQVADAPEALPPNGPAPPKFRFGRMFDLRQRLSDAERQEIIPRLIDLGTAMNDSTTLSVDSKIPAGYTYLGQLIAHE